jgi:hypothetical protein
VKNEVSKKVLVFSDLKSQVDYKSKCFLDHEEPFHPYIGLRWANFLQTGGFDIYYLNNENLLLIKSTNSFIKLYHTYRRIPKSFSTVVVHSTSGLGKAALLRIFNWRLNIIFFSLSKINPDGGIGKYFVRRFIHYLDLSASNAVVFGLKTLIGKRSKVEQKLYLPFYVDINFFKSIIESSNKNYIINSKYLLIVGDITRDDRYAYSELDDLDIPIIRVSRDVRVIDIAKTYYNPVRGDKIISGVSFAELANLYRNSVCCIIASKYDYWQPGGITSIVEALACSSICVANAGGEIETEFYALSALNKVPDPIEYYRYPEKGALRNKVLSILNLSEEESLNKKNKSLSYAIHCLNLNEKGLIYFKNEILPYFK